MNSSIFLSILSNHLGNGVADVITSSNITRYTTMLGKAYESSPNLPSSDIIMWIIYIVFTAALVYWIITNIVKAIYFVVKITITIAITITIINYITGGKLIKLYYDLKNSE